MRKELEVKPAENKSEPEKTEKPIENNKILSTLPEKEAQHVMSKATDVCVIYQSMLNLPDSSKMEKDSNFYVEELIRILIDHGLLTQ